MFEKMGALQLRCYTHDADQYPFQLDIHTKYGANVTFVALVNKISWMRELCPVSFHNGF